MVSSHNSMDVVIVDVGMTLLDNNSQYTFILIKGLVMIQVQHIGEDVEKEECHIDGDYKPSVDDILKLFIFRIVTPTDTVNIYAKNLVSVASNGNMIEVMKKKEKRIFKIKGVRYEKTGTSPVLW